MRNFFVGLALVAGLILNSTPGRAAEKMTVLLDWFVNPDHAGVIIAKEKGFFSKNGLDVEIIEPADPSTPPRLVAAGQADVALSYQPDLYEQVEQGIPVVRIGTAVATPLNSLIVLENGPIHTISDLKGKTVGYSSEGFGQALLSSMLEKNGLSLKDVTLVNVNFALTPSLLEGKVDAVIDGYRNFELIELKQAGKSGKAFFPEDYNIPAYDELIYIARQDQANSQKTAHFLDSLDEASLFIINHPDEAWAIILKAYPKLDDELNKAAFAQTLPRLAANPRAVDAIRYQHFGEFMQARGLIKKVEPVSRYIGTPPQ